MDNKNEQKKRRVSPSHLQLKQRKVQRASDVQIKQQLQNYDNSTAENIHVKKRSKQPKKIGEKRVTKPVLENKKINKSSKSKKISSSFFDPNKLGILGVIILLIGGGYFFFFMPNSYRVFVGEQHVATIAHGQIGEYDFIKVVMAMLETSLNTEVTLVDEITLRSSNTRTGTHIHRDQALAQAVANISYKVNGGLFILNGESLFTTLSPSQGSDIIYTIAENLVPQSSQILSVEGYGLQIVPNLIYYEEVVSTAMAVNTLTSATREYLPHVARFGESFWSIANTYNISLNELITLNPDTPPETLREGDVIIVAHDIPLLTILTEEELYIYENIIPPTEHANNPNLAQGQANTLQEGTPGQLRNVYLVMRTNGIETSRTLISEEILAHPTPYIIEIGVN